MIIGMIKGASDRKIGWQGKPFSGEAGGLEPAVGGVQVMCSGRIARWSQAGSWTVVRSPGD
jgi:hypothetical protein